MSGNHRLAGLLKVLAEPNRLRIVRHLAHECRSVSDVMRATGLPQTNVSFHLRVLRECGLVTASRRGAFVYYCLRDAQLLEFLRDIESWLVRLDAGDPLAGDPRKASGHGATGPGQAQEETL